MINQPNRKVKRLQGTDGIRGEITLSSDPRVEGLTSIEAFTERRLLTDKFFELYAYSAALEFKNTFTINSKPKIVVGWDPRDKKLNFVSCVKKGIKKAGCDVISIGRMPTPSVPIYVIYSGADGGLMVTASHNPPDQNGIKIFYGLNGLKPLPDDDIRITGIVYDNENTKFEALKEIGSEFDEHEKAKKLFIDMIIDPQNSWVGDLSNFQKIILVVDPANGSYCGIAYEIFRKIGFLDVIEVSNNADSGKVNENSGVASLEGYLVIEPSMVFTSETVATSPNFMNHRAVQKVFEIGREHSKNIKYGKTLVSGAIFDADGDRFYRLDYDPFSDEIIVSSGDETAFHQVKYLLEKNPAKYKGSIYVNTVESDLLVSNSLEKLGVVPITKPVGDKWILNVAASSDIQFSVGAEETGHNITEAFITMNDGHIKSVYAGNGIKSAVNTFVATGSLLNNLSPMEYFELLREPFKRGYKRTFYAYYTDKSLLTRDSEIFKRADNEIRKVLGKLFNFRLEEVSFTEEPDLLYFKRIDFNGIQMCSLFLRNSGTEEKTAFYIRGDSKFCKDFDICGEEIRRFIKVIMRNSSSDFSFSETDTLLELKKRRMTRSELESFILSKTKIKKESLERFIRELKIQNFIEIINSSSIDGDDVIYRPSENALKYLEDLELFK
jgi:phosphoglucosamine mutase